jgi:hypothetical protein
MNPWVRPTQGPEAIIQRDIIKFLQERKWTVRVMHASALVFGLPDLLAWHKKHGQRWIEIKNPESYSFTDAQIQTFVEWTECRIPFYILTAATEREYQKLFGKPNFVEYYHP